MLLLLMLLLLLLLLLLMMLLLPPPPPPLLTPPALLTPPPLLSLLPPPPPPPPPPPNHCCWYLSEPSTQQQPWRGRQVASQRRPTPGTIARLHAPPPPTCHCEHIASEAQVRSRSSVGGTCRPPVAAGEAARDGFLPARQRVAIHIEFFLVARGAWADLVFGLRQARAKNPEDAAHGAATIRVRLQRKTNSRIA